MAIAQACHPEERSVRPKDLKASKRRFLPFGYDVAAGRTPAAQNDSHVEQSPRMGKWREDIIPTDL
jgi:hypothetical protein